jgi:metal-dependent amidase/aminoacylase/carboxypeptidase family protein
MENLKQGVAPLILLRKHKYPEVSGKKSEPQKITSFLEKYPADEIITNIGETGIIAIYNGENQGKQSCLDVS